MPAVDTTASAGATARILAAARAVGIATVDDDKPNAGQNGDRTARILANLKACGLLPREATRG